MKKVLALVMTLLMSMTVFAGCSVDVKVNGTPIEEISDDGITADEVPIVLSIDAFNDANGQGYEFEYTEFGQKCKLGALQIYVSETGKTIAKTLAEESYEDIRLLGEDSDNFEGWMEYEVTVKYDSDNCEYYTYKRANDELLSTKEMLNKKMPDHSVAYIAKWSDTPQEDYDYLENIE